MDYLVDKWVHLSDEEYYKTGKIVSHICDDLYVFRLDARENSDNPVNGRLEEVISLRKYLFQSPDCDWAGVNVFETEKDMRDYLAWMEEPVKTERKEEGTVVSFRKS